jgi:hypothetical protein
MTVRLNIGCGQSPTEGWINYDDSFAVRMAGSPLLTWAMRRTGLADAGNLEFAASPR